MARRVAPAHSRHHRALTVDYDAIRQAADRIADATGRRHAVAIVLGSGLSEYARRLPGAIELPYDQIPGAPTPKVAGHAGTAVSASFQRGNALVLAGRVHLYEGWSPDEIVFLVRAAVLGGCRTVLLTNAAGGVNRDYAPGDLVLLRDHINLTARSPLMGPNDDRLGPRFPDMTEVYSRRLRDTAHHIAGLAGISLHEGVYTWFTGPAYETPAEVEMARRIGGDLVGMSTVPEAVAARHMGAEVLGLSLVTNLAAGISPTPLSHDEVKAAGVAAAERIAALFDGILSELLGPPKQ